ncbi:MAG: SLC13 family permease [Woeseiaceae bacterium]|nr:SLC13 family permease [Woeseiaceae bacterium]
MEMTPHALAAVAFTVAALALISRDRIPIEYAAGIVLTVLVLVFEIFPVTGPGALRGADLFRGFGNEALVTICLLLVLARGVEISGALRPVGRFLTALWLRNRTLALFATLVVAALISAFANNTPIVVMMLPILVGVAHRIGIPPSKVLMPAGFATIVGGMSTTIGTSTNLLVVSVSEDYGLPRLEMFDFILPAAAAAAAGLLYLWLVAPQLLPARAYRLEGKDSRVFDSVLTIPDDSPLAGQTLAAVIGRLGELTRIVRIQRGDSLELARLPTLTIKAGDRLHLRGTAEGIRLAHDAIGGSVTAVDLTQPPNQALVEIVVTRNSPLHMKRLGDVRNDTLRGLYPVGWSRPGQSSLAAVDKSGDPLLRTGDILLMQGERGTVQDLVDRSHILVLARNIHVPRTSKATLAMAIMAGVVAVAALGLLPIVASALLGVALMLAGRCLDWHEAWEAIDTRLVLVIVVSLALGSMLVETGAAAAVAHGFVVLVEDLPPPVVLSGLLLLTALLTEVVTNNAIAVIATPIAMSVAAELGQPALPFVLAVLFGANMSYLTPIGYQTNMLVMSAGGYRFGDFFRAGLPLQIILWAVLSLVLPALYL